MDTRAKIYELYDKFYGDERDDNALTMPNMAITFTKVCMVAEIEDRIIELDQQAAVESLSMQINIYRTISGLKEAIRIIKGQPGE